MKKILIGAIVSVVLVSAAVFSVWQFRRIAPSPASRQDQIINNQPAATTTMPASGTSTKPVINSLRSEAMKIISRPLMIKTALSEAAKKETIANIEEAKASIRANYDHDTPWLQLGAYRRAMEDNEGAIEAWKFLLKIRPHNFMASHNLGEVYGYALKNYTQGEMYFLRSINDNPDDIDGYSQLVGLYEAQGQFTKAENLLLSGIQARPKNAALSIRLGTLYEQQGKKQEALAQYENALKLDPKNQALESEVANLRASLQGN